MESPQKSRSNLRELQKKRKSLDERRSNDKTGYSLENLRLVTLLNQMQALQAVQGFQELKPKDKGNKYRFDIPEDPKERAYKRHWLTFKADWLEALLEDTVDELEALGRYEGITDTGSRCEGRKYPRKPMKISASYEITLDGAKGECKSCKVIDISIGGVRLLLNEEVKVNTVLKISLQDGCALDGTVLWSKKFENDAEKYNTGVMFRDMNEVLVNRIGKYIEDQR